MDEGLARAIGVSNFSVVKLKDLMKHARIKPAVNQIEVHPYLRNDDVIEHCRAQVSNLSRPQVHKYCCCVQQRLYWMVSNILRHIM